MIKQIIAMCLGFLLFANSTFVGLASELVTTDRETLNSTTTRDTSAEAIINGADEDTSGREVLDGDLKINNEINPEINPEISLPDITDIGDGLLLENSTSNDLVLPEINIDDALQVDAVQKDLEQQKAVGDNIILQADKFIGALVMEYPIKLPPGRNNFSPDLKVFYNSGNTNSDGLLGKGWSLNIPSIKRINKNGTNKLYDSHDFSSSADGELRFTKQLVSGKYGSYEPEIKNEKNLKYELKLENGNEYWQVKDKSGFTYKYGYGQNAKQNNPNMTAEIYSWMLDEIRDSNDNFIKYEYFKEGNQVYTSKIIYTGHGTTQGIYTVEFGYSPRSDQIISYEAGFKVHTSKILSTIKATAYGVADSVNMYSFNYSSADNGITSILNSINQSGTSTETGAIYLPSDEMKYQKNEGKWLQNLNYTIPVDLFNGMTEKSGARIFEVNGDGFPDIVFARVGSPQAVYINQGGAGWKLDSNYQVPVYFVTDSGNDLGARIVDVNGDHLDDIIYSSYNTTDQYGNLGGRVYINQGPGKSWTWDKTYNFPNFFGQDTFVDQNYNDIGIRLIDVNGDGLVDFIDQSGFVYLSKGDGNWEENLFKKVPKDKYTQGLAFADVNGDHLVDVIISSKYENKVYVNNGKQWDLDTNYSVPVYMGVETRLEDANGDGLIDILYGPWYSSKRKVYINKGNGTGWQENSQYTIPEAFTDGSIDNGVRLADVNGDGLVDFLYRHDIGSTIQSKVYPHYGKVPDLLNLFHTKKGADLKVKYKSSAQYDNPKLPFIFQTVESISNYDNINTSPVITSFKYEGGEYYYKGPFDRKFAGFANIAEIDGDGNGQKTYYHQGNATDSSIGEYKDEYVKISYPYLLEKYDKNGNIYSKSFTHWDKTWFGNVGYGGQNRYFVRPTQNVVLTYDGNSSYRASAELYSYDPTYSDLSVKTMMGEVNASGTGDVLSDIGNDKRTLEISYANDINKTIRLRAVETLKNQSGSWISQSQNYYDNLGLFSLSKGNLTKNSNWNYGNKYIASTKSYNNYGLVAQEVDALGNKTNYSYDSYQIFPTTISNALNQSITMIYDYTSGGIKKLTDANGSIFETKYDALDRPIEQKQPNNSGQTVTAKKFGYGDASFPTYSYEWQWAIDNGGPVTYNYYDGFGRVIQTRKEIEDSSIFSVKDYKYDTLGHMEKESLPYISNGMSKTSANGNNNLYIKYTYDPLGRKKTINNALGTSSYTYDDWKVTITDAKNNKKDLYYDVFQNLVKVIEHNGGAAYTTNYEYNGLDKLSKVTDALNNSKKISYDSLGRKIFEEDLHASGDNYFAKHNYSYDDNGNLLTYTDPNGQKTSYQYDALNRITAEDFDGSAGTEISYSYDNCSNGKLLLCGVNTNSVNTSYTYNKVGDVLTETRKIDNTNYVTKFEYDRLHNILSIIYPDNTQINNSYNEEAKLKNVKNGATFLIKNIEYSPTLAVSKIEYGNGVVSKNNFDPQKLYLLTSKTSESGLNKIQNISYDYDAVGNVTKITDTSPFSISKISTYQYDSLNRLISTAATNTGNSQNYTQSYQYDAIGNITYKSDKGNYLYQGNLGASSATPHAVTKVASSTYDYDKNGNLITDGQKTLSWNYKNQMVQSTLNGKVTNYTYDQNGERVKKESSAGAELYPNQYYEKRGEKLVKNIFIGSQKVATIESGKSVATPPTPQTSEDAIILEDAEDGDSLGWSSYSPGKNITNIYDTEKQSKVISLDYAGGYQLMNENGGYFDESTHKVLSLDMKYDKPVYLRIMLDTNKGTKYLVYSTYNYANVPGSYFINYQLDSALKDGKWHTIVKDLQADIESAQPGTTINKIKYIQFWWGGNKLDNIKLLKSAQQSQPQSQATNDLMLEDAEDGDTLGWGTYNSGKKISNIYDSDKQSKVISLDYPAGYELRNEDGTLWNDTTHTKFGWDMKVDKAIYLRLITETNKGFRAIVYSTYDYTSSEYYINFKLDPSLKDGKWHSVVKDLQADVSSVQPDTKITKIKYMQFWWGGGSLDNVKFIGDAPEVQNEPVATNSGPQTIYHHTDHLSGTSIDTDENGKVVEAIDYYPFGEVRVDQFGGHDNPYKYTGKELDDESGLYYYGARYYNAAIGRFISQDPWGGDLTNPQSLNKYSYVLNNPLRYIDPTGMEAIESAINFFSTLNNVNMYIGDKLTFGFFSKAIEEAQEAGEKIADDGLSWDTALNAAEKVSLGTATTGGSALLEGITMGKGKVLLGSLGKFLKFKGKGGEELSMMQPSVSTKFSDKGTQSGKYLKDVIEGLKNGEISPEDIPIGYVKDNGKNIVINNRSFTVIKNSGVTPHAVDQTMYKPARNFAKYLYKKSGGKVFDTMKFK